MWWLRNEFHRVQCVLKLVRLVSFSFDLKGPGMLKKKSQVLHTVTMASSTQQLSHQSNIKIWFHATIVGMYHLFSWFHNLELLQLGNASLQIVRDWLFTEIIIVICQGITSRLLQHSCFSYFLISSVPTLVCVVSMVRSQYHTAELSSKRF